MQDYYCNLREELFVKRKQLRTLTLQSKIQGDFSEALIREFLVKFIADSFAVKHGILYDDKGKSSKECDIIIYEKDNKPWFEFGDLVIANPEDVRFVIQIKSSITSSTLKSAIDNLKAVKKLNKNIWCWIVGYETTLLFRTLYLNAWRSRSVQFLHAFRSGRKIENKSLLNAQMEQFVKTIRHCGNYSQYSWSDSLHVCQTDTDRIVLPSDSDEKKIKSIISGIYENSENLKQHRIHTRLQTERVTD
jgi:hypothetical protein